MHSISIIASIIIANENNKASVSVDRVLSENTSRLVLVTNVYYEG